MSPTDQNSVSTTGADAARRQPLWRRAQTAVLVLFGLFLVVRAAVDPFVRDFGDPADYAADWGGPSLIGVLAVHMVPGIISGVLLVLWWRRRTVTRGRG